MAKLPIDDPEYFHSRAEEARSMADAMRDPETRRLMISLANEELAKLAEARLKAEKLDLRSAQISGGYASERRPT